MPFSVLIPCGARLTEQFMQCLQRTQAQDRRTGFAPAFPETVSATCVHFSSAHEARAPLLFVYSRSLTFMHLWCF